MKLRFANNDDVNCLYYLEQRCNPAPWSKEQLTDALIHNHCLVAHEDENIIGMLIWQQLFDEAEIYLINTLPEKHRQGVASRLLDYLLNFSTGRPILKVFLEVREDNKGAQALYQKYGFEVIAVRKDYYRCTDGTTQNALVMEYVDVK